MQFFCILYIVLKQLNICNNFPQTINRNSYQSIYEYIITLIEKLVLKSPPVK